MKRILYLISFSSLNVLLVTIERFSFTTKVLLQPFNFLRLHEVFQIVTLILFTVIIPFLLLKEVTRNFDLLKTRRGILLGVIFISGIYFYATGNGIHELASFFFNTYCPIDRLSTIQCNGMFFNDYYFGNILYFIGAILMNLPLLLFEQKNPQKQMRKKEMLLLILNAFIYAFAIFAYAAFDKVLVGLVYAVIFTGISVYFFIKVKSEYKRYPLATYSVIAYTVGTVFAAFVRLF